MYNVKLVTCLVLSAFLVGLSGIPAAEASLSDLRSQIRGVPSTSSATAPAAPAPTTKLNPAKPPKAQAPPKAKAQVSKAPKATSAPATPKEASTWASIKNALSKSKTSISSFFKSIVGSKPNPASAPTPVTAPTTPAASSSPAATTASKTPIDKAIVEDAKKTFAGKTGIEKLWRKLTAWHYETRDKKNGPPVSFEDCSKPGSGWQLLSASMSIYHDNGKGKPELKFVHPDGREAVFDGDTHLPVRDTRYKGTYNYVVPTSTESVTGLTSAVKFVAKGLGHVVMDVIPYKVLGGNSRVEAFKGK